MYMIQHMEYETIVMELTKFGIFGLDEGSFVF